MSKPMSAGVLIFRQSAADLQVLMVEDLSHRKCPWGFPKGSREAKALKEAILDCAKREAREEAGVECEQDFTFIVDEKFQLDDYWNEGETLQGLVCARELSPKGNPGTLYFLCNAAGRLLEEQPQMHTNMPEEIGQVKFLSVDKAQQLLSVRPNRARFLKEAAYLFNSYRE